MLLYENEIRFRYPWHVFFGLVLGYSSDTPPNPGNPNNNNVDADCVPCTETDAKSYGVGNHGPLLASAVGRAWKEENEFKWRSTTVVKNSDKHIKGAYMLMYGIPHTRVVVKFERDDVENVDADPNHFAFTDRYEGIMGAIFAVQSTKPFTTQNAKIEVNKTFATSYIDGKPLSDIDPNSPNKYVASADNPRCICNDDDDGDNNGNFIEPNNESPLLPGLRPSNGSADPVVSPGGTHEAELVTSEPYYYVRWYVKGPCDASSLGTLVQTDEGWSTGTETEASLSYTFSTDAVLGVYTITAVSERYSNLSEGSTRSYTVTVE